MSNITINIIFQFEAKTIFITYNKIEV